MKTSQPTGPGWWEFDGWRSTPSGKWQVSVKDLVKVVEGHRNGTYRVLHAGSNLQYSTEMYEGTWERVDVGQEGQP